MDVYRYTEYGIGAIGFLMVFGWLGLIGLAASNGDMEFTLILVLITILIVRVAVKELIDI